MASILHTMANNVTRAPALGELLKLVQPDSPFDRLSDEPLPLGRGRNDDWPPRKRPSLAKRSLRAVVRYLITFRYLIIFCTGVSATLAWQSYGDVARQMIADSSPVLGWLAPSTAPLVQVVSGEVTAQPAPPSADARPLKEPDLATVRQSMDQLAAKVHEMAGDIATLHATQQAILRKVSLSPRQPSAPARN